MEKIDEVLSIFQKEMKAWLDNPASHAFWGSCQEVNDRAMTDKGSGVFIDAVKEMTEKGVELVLRSIKAAYMGEYFELSGEMKEGKEHDGELTWLLAVGDTFLQILADKAGEMGGDARTIQSIIGKSPRGGVGLTTEESIIQGCQTGSNDEKEQEGELVCNQPQQEQQNSTRRKGRPKDTLKDKMIDDADGEKLQKIHAIWGNSKGKDAALIILACILMGWMKKPTFTQVIVEFGEVGSKSGYNRYLNRKSFTDDEIKGIMNALNSL